MTGMTDGGGVMKGADDRLMNVKISGNIESAFVELRFRRKSILYTRFGLGILTHNVVTFFGAKFPQPVENSRASSLATILVTVVVVTRSVMLRP